MRKLLFILGAASLLVMSSCNKNQSAVKKMDGTWTIDKMVTADENGNTFTDNESSGTYTFTECKLKKDEWCTASYSITAFGFTFSDAYEYRVTGDGETLESREDSADTTPETASIEELTKTTLIIRSTDSDGSYSETHLSK